jgi:hypothetical protein
MPQKVVVETNAKTFEKKLTELFESGWSVVPGCLSVSTSASKGEYSTIEKDLLSAVVEK